MSPDPVRDIAQAVLYEGYLLWPYRRSALKNKQRFTFGGVHPAAFAHENGDRSEIRMECLLEHGGVRRVDLTVRWLQLVDRQPLRHGEPVDEVVAGGERVLAFEEATEREVAVGPLSVDELCAGCSLPVEIAAGEEIEELGDAAALRHAWKSLEGRLDIHASRLASGALALTVRFANTSSSAVAERDEALRRSFLSTHMVAHAEGGQWVSLTDPPDELEGDVALCANEGIWPVLAGEPGSRDTLLGSPIILSDYPSVAPESPGDLFDGGEIDALLIHSIRGLTDEEREEMRATDPRAREILERSVGLSDDQLLRLYGAVREMRPRES